MINAESKLLLAQRLLPEDTERALELILEFRHDLRQIEQVEAFAQWDLQSLLLLGNLYHKLGDHELAKQCFEQALTQPSIGEFHELHIKLLIGLCKVRRDLGELNEALRAGHQALAMLAPDKDQSQVAEVSNVMAGIEYSLGNTKASIDLLSRAIEVYGLQDDLAAATACLLNLAIIYYTEGRYSKSLAISIDCYNEMIKNKIGQPHMKISCLNNIGNNYSAMGDLENAKKYYYEALHESSLIDSSQYIVSSLTNIFITEAELGNFEEAVRLSQRALELTEKYGYISQEADLLQNTGDLFFRQGNYAQALAFHERALEIAGKLGIIDCQIGALIGKAECLLQYGENQEAKRHLLRAMEISEQGSRRQAITRCHKLLAEACASLEDFEGAYLHHKQFHDLDKQIFNEESEKRLAQLTATFELARAQEETEIYRQRNEAAEEALKAAEELVVYRTEELEQAKVEVVTRLALAAEYRDDITGEHTKRVGYYAAAIALELQVDIQDVYLLQHAARLHDVGKIGIPDSILLKRDRLLPEEFEAIKKHTLIGERILSNGQSSLLQMARDIAVSHHERWDGAGYPHGLSGKDIPLMGRIVAVADVFDALTQPRPYKNAWSLQDSILEIERLAGSSFDPHVVAASLSVFRRLTTASEQISLEELGISESLSNVSIHSQLAGPFANIEYFRTAIDPKKTAGALK